MKKRSSCAKDDHMTEALIERLCGDERVQQMRGFIQHGSITTYDHCVSVTKLSLGINRALRLNADKKVLVKGAMLHDFYLYDWHEDDPSHRLHGYIHAARAAKNAKKHFGIDRKVHHVIYVHMWPLNLTRLPMSREAWIVCAADKLVSIKETLFMRSEKK